MKKTIVLINGKKRSGKDFSASILHEKLAVKNTVTTMSVAGPMKNIISTIFGISLEQLDKFKNEPENYMIKIDGFPEYEGTTFRQTLTRFGTDAMYPEFGENVWADLFVSKIKESKSDIILVPDFRYISEHVSALETGFNVVTLFINNDECDSVDTHRSETELDDFRFDYSIDNTGYSEKLYDYLDTFIAEKLT